jgi:hypothetical protein
MIPLNTHGILDYVIGAVLVASPYVFGFSQIPEAASVFLALGIGLIAYSLLTRYKYSVLKLVPIPLHMFLDAAIGVFIMLAPSLFAYQALLTTGQYVLHFALGLGTLAFVALTGPTDRSAVVAVSEEEDQVRFPRRAA